MKSHSTKNKKTLGTKHTDRPSKITEKISKLSCFYTNARSLNNKLDEFNTVVSQLNPDIIGITETWATSNNFNEEFNVNNNYKVFRHDRPIGKKGGGVMLLVKDTLQAVEDKCKHNQDSDVLETVWCNIKLNYRQTKFLKVGVCYRPNVNEQSDLIMAKEIEWACKGDVLIMGDFNYSNIDWNIMNGMSRDENMFIDVVQDNYLHQHVREPTRGGNTLDLVLSKSELDVQNLNVSYNLGKSDHNIITWEFVTCVAFKENKIKVPDFRKADFNKFRKLLSNVEWTKMFREKSVNQIWEMFKSILIEGMSNCIPYRQLRRKDRPKWLNREIQSLTKLKAEKWKELREAGITEGGQFDNFKLLEKKVHKVIRKSKASFEENMANKIKENPKNFFSYIRAKNKGKEGIGPLKNDSGKVVSSYKEMAVLLNDFFSSVFTIEDLTVIPNGEETLGVGSFQNIEFTDNLILKKIEKLNANKASGPDNLAPRILKELANEIVVPLNIIFNRSLIEGVVPVDWRLANVTPIFKKG